MNGVTSRDGFIVAYAAHLNCVSKVLRWQMGGAVQGGPVNAMNALAAKLTVLAASSLLYATDMHTQCPPSQVRT